MILYFSGTGNSGYAARRIADGLGEPLLCLNDRIKAGDTAPVETGERLVIVTPTYAWRIPRIVEDWLLHTELTGAKRAWFVMTCGSEIGDADRYNRRLCQAKGLACMGTAQIVMPENYIAMFNAPQVEEARQIVARAEPDIPANTMEDRTFAWARPPGRWPIHFSNIPKSRSVKPTSFIKQPTNRKAGRASMLKSARELAVFWANITKDWWLNTTYSKAEAIIA